MPKLDDLLWLGTQQAHDLLETKLQLAEEAQASGSFKAGMEEDLPPVMSVQDGTAVIDIHGPLVSGSAGFWRFFGVLGYDDIADNLINAVSNPDVKSIVLSIDSGGGAVSGVQDLADMIAEIDKIKPVVSHTSGMMASAAYWLGASARKVFVTPTSESGSIGVLSIHAERSKQLADAGVKVTIVRAGKYKALANPYEPLSDEAKAEIQAKADQLYDMFIGYVADRRGMTVATADQKAGQGRTFLGGKAVEVNLADGLKNLGATVKYAGSLGTPKRSANMRTGLTATVDKSVVAANNPEQSGNTSMSKAYTPEQLAALAAGASEDMLETVAETTETVTETVSEETTATETTETMAETVVESKADVLAFVQTQLSAANEQLVASKVEIAQLKAQVDQMKASHDGLLQIAQDSVGKMLVALGSSAVAASGLDATSILAEHARVSELFKSKFKVGGVASTKPEAKPTATKASIDPMFAFAASTVSQGA